MGKISEMTKSLLGMITDLTDDFTGAYSIRQNGSCAAMQSGKNIEIKPKTDRPGLDIYISGKCDGEKVYIPACVTKSDVDDLVYNDFYVADGANAIIVAGCGVHTDEGSARHSGVHRFFVGEGAKLRYEEKHVGTGSEEAVRIIDPITEIYLSKNSVLEMDTSQIGGVDQTMRKTTAKAEAGAKLFINERLLTDGDQQADTFFEVELNGDDSGADIVSHSVAKDTSRQSYISTIIGNAACSGHSECDAIIAGKAIVDAAPKLYARHVDAALIHEAAIGKIAGDQILKLCTLGLTEEEAEAKIIEGFLS